MPLSAFENGGTERVVRTDPELLARFHAGKLTMVDRMRLSSLKTS